MCIQTTAGLQSAFVSSFSCRSPPTGGEVVTEILILSSIHKHQASVDTRTVQDEMN